MKLDHQAESLTDLCARYAAAVSEIVDAHAVMNGLAEAPSGKREHVFDCADGVRLIISRERIHGRVGVHFSSSCEPDSEIGRSIADARTSPRDFRELTVSRWRALSGSTQLPQFLGFSDGGIPHFIAWQDN